MRRSVLVEPKQVEEPPPLMHRSHTATVIAATVLATILAVALFLALS